MTMKSFKVAVLGATGMVGQRFISMLAGHKRFKLASLVASERSAGKEYKAAAKWYLDEPMPEKIKGMVVEDMIPKKIDADIVFSALPSEIAKEAEPAFAKEGFIVCSNASSFRMHNDVPLLIPEVNPEHLELIEVQKKKRKWSGCIITNPNCTSIMFTLALKPIYDAFGISSLSIVSMQGLSGAGYDGVPSMAIVDNVIPFIKGEEEKVETEVLKIYGKFDKGKGRIREEKLDISASCNRVSVLEGHLESLFVKTEKKAEIEEIKEKFSSFKALPQKLKLPTAPEKPIIVFEQDDRPQPRLDRMRGNGMSVCVGRIRRDKNSGFKCTVLGHNTIRGAAGASILNAELLAETRL